MKTTTFSLLSQRCGLSLREAAEFLGVRPDTVESWSSGRRSVPPGVIDQLRALYTSIDRAARETLSVASEAPEGAVVELGVASDDAEAQSLGWPCVGAHRAVLGLVAAGLKGRVVIVPRGSTPATARAAREHAKEDPRRSGGAGHRGL